MKNLSDIFGVGPGNAAVLAEEGIRTTRDLASCENLEALSKATGIQPSLLAQWKSDSKDAVRAARTRKLLLAILGVIAISAFVGIGLQLTSEQRLNADEIFWNANALYNNGEYDKAASILDVAIEKGISSSDIYNLRAMIYHANDQMDVAEKYYLQAIQLNRLNAFAINNLANLQTSSGRYTEAEANYRRALQILPSESLFHSNLAKLMIDLGKLEEAISLYGQAIALTPAEINLYQLQSQLYERIGRLEEAGAALQNAIDNNPDSPEALSSYGRFLERRQEHEQAAEYFLKANRLAGGGRHLADAARNFRLAGSYGKALNLYSELALIEPDVWYWQFQVGWTNLQLGMDRRAIGRAALTQLLENFPEDSMNKWAYLNLAISFTNDDLSRAQSMIDKALEIDPEFIPALAQDGYFKEAQGRYQDAIEIYEKIIGLDPKNTNAYLDLYELYTFKLADREKARESAARLAQVAKSNDYNLLYVQLHEVEIKGDFQAKQEILRRIKDNYPNDVWFIIKICEAELLQGRDANDINMIRGAIKRIDVAIETNPYRHPHMARLHFIKAWGHHVVPQIKDLDVAEQYYKKAIKYDPNWLIPIGNLSNIYLERGKFTEAVSLIRRALSLNSNDVFININMGHLLFLTGELEEAKMHYGRALEIAPHDPLAHAGRALVNIWLNDQVAARQDIDVARKYLRDPTADEIGTQWEVAIQKSYSPLGQLGMVHLNSQNEKEAFLDVLIGTTYLRDSRENDAIENYQKGWNRVVDDKATSTELAVFALSQVQRHSETTTSDMSLQRSEELLQKWLDSH